MFVYSKVVRRLDSDSLCGSMMACMSVGEENDEDSQHSLKMRHSSVLLPVSRRRLTEVRRCLTHNGELN